MKVVIAGGRDYRLSPDEFQDLLLFFHEFSVTEIVSGGAAGVDADGEYAARKVGLNITRFPADWKKHGKAAGPIRNKQMAEYADAVFLFPGGRGTASMKREAEKANLLIFGSAI